VTTPLVVTEFLLPISELPILALFLIYTNSERWLARASYFCIYTGQFLLDLYEVLNNVHTSMVRCKVHKLNLVYDVRHNSPDFYMYARYDQE